MERGVWSPPPERSRYSSGVGDLADDWSRWQMLASVTCALPERSRDVKRLLAGKHLEME